MKAITRYGLVIKNSGDFVLRSSIEMASDLCEANVRLEQSLAVLRHSEHKYRTALLTSPDSMNINTMDGTRMEVNDDFINLPGYARGEAIRVSPRRPSRRIKVSLTCSGELEPKPAARRQRHRRRLRLPGFSPKSPGLSPFPDRASSNDSNRTSDPPRLH